MRLLIVDDEYWIRYKLIHRFDWEQFGFDEVAEASNGEEAMRLICERKVDAVITDMDMPFMDGGTFMNQLRKQEPELPVIVLSGYSDFPTVHSAILGGAADYLLKPVKAEELYAVMRRVLNLPAESSESETEGAQPSVNEGTLAHIGAYIRDHFEEELSLAGLAERFAVSPSHLSRSFKREFGVNLTAYITQCRMNAARDMLDSGEKNISTVAASVGYDDYAYFSSLFKKQFGLPPREYQKKQSGEQ